MPPCSAAPVPAPGAAAAASAPEEPLASEALASSGAASSLSLAPFEEEQSAMVRNYCRKSHVCMQTMHFKATETISFNEGTSNK